MAEIQPFRAFHYGDKFIKGIKKRVCPPYDVISPKEQERLIRRDPVNFVRVELPKGTTDKKYKDAAGIWYRWLDEGVLDQDPFPAFYIYQASFASPSDGRPLVRRGFFAALKLVPWGKGVHPHEKTLPTAKADRMKLFQAMSVQTSPIQCLFTDGENRAEKILSRLSRGKPWVDYDDETGVRHKLWRLDDDKEIKNLQKILARSRVAIADGHHRYETSRAYEAWAEEKWGKKSPASGYVMAYFSPSGDRGLEILPTHRAVAWEKRRFVQLEKWGTLEPASGLKSMDDIVRGKKGSGALGVYCDGKFFNYTFAKIPSGVKKTPHENLAVARLHAGPLDGLGKEDFFFTRRPEEAVEFARKNKGWAFFLSPNTVDEVLRVAVSGRVMPPKSTYFHPKIPSGLLSRSLVGLL